jgi:hypothetical protein
MYSAKRRIEEPSHLDCAKALPQLLAEATLDTTKLDKKRPREGTRRGLALRQVKLMVRNHRQENSKRSSS